MDLLLHLIRKQKINIYDIPIALIARQYLEYLSLHEDAQFVFSWRVFGDGIHTVVYQISDVTPQRGNAIDAEDEEVIDPRSELVRQLNRV